MNRILTSLLVLILSLTACQKEVSQEAGTLSSGTLQNSAGECLPKNVGGNFIVNKVLNDSNFIEVSVDVVLPGAYTIFTDTVNGYSFKGQGSFASAGLATVKLMGNGKPLVAGIDDFTVFYDSTLCSIAVTVMPEGTTPPPVGSGLYFPLTNNSWWSYDEGPGTDSFKVTSNGTKLLDGKTYSRFLYSDDFGMADTGYFRLDASTNSYYQYQSTDEFANLGITVTQPSMEVLFLKENLTTNATWNSDITGSQGPIPITIRFKATCINNNLTVSVNGKNFTNVYHVRLQLQMGTFGTFTDIESIDTYYAKGIGRIRAFNASSEGMIRNWQVF
jgi:hypothetical protein